MAQSPSSCRKTFHSGASAAGIPRQRLAWLFLLAAGALHAQPMQPGHEQHGGPAQPQTPTQTPDAPPARHEGMEMGKGMRRDMGKGMDHGMSTPMRSAFGPYSMTRGGSGTSWQPEATPMEGLHMMGGDWSVMLHGFVNVIHDRQTGPRGDRKTFAESMLMGMGQRPMGRGTLGLRAMVSADAAMGKGGYPLLFQTGETADGRSPLIDRQHPHDAFMELSASYSMPFGQNGAVFAYGGLPGEPALGPPAFMHRFSGMRNPEAPLTHHWLDSTHITFGVATLGVNQGPWKIEGSWFNGREPDQNRWNIETRKFDSWSSRLSFNPTPAWALQVSYGDLKSPELLEPSLRIKRVTASASYHARVAGNEWQTTLAWGRNDKRGPEGRVKQPGWLLESSYVAGKHTAFGRIEQVRNDELFFEGHPLHGQAFRIRKLSLGYIYDFVKTGPVQWGVGGLVGLPRAPAELDPNYGSRPKSYMVFLQGRV